MEFGIDKVIPKEDKLIINTHLSNSCEENFTNFCYKIMKNIKDFKYDLVKKQILRCISERIFQTNISPIPDWGHTVVLFHLINLYEKLFNLKSPNFNDHDFKMDMMQKFESNYSLHYANIEDETAKPPYCKKWSDITDNIRQIIGFYLHNNDSINKKCLYINNNLQETEWKLSSKIYYDEINDILSECADKINDHISGMKLLNPGDLLKYYDYSMKLRGYPFTGRLHGPDSTDKYNINVLEYYSKPYNYNIIRRRPEPLFDKLLENKLIINYEKNMEKFLELRNIEKLWYNNYINQEKIKNILNEEKQYYNILNKNDREINDGFKKIKSKRNRTMKEKYLKYKLKYLKLKQELNL